MNPGPTEPIAHFHPTTGRAKSTDLVDLVAATIKAYQASPDKLAGLIAQHGSRPVYTALLELQTDAQSQICDVNARWAAFKATGTIPTPEFRAALRDHEVVRAKIVRYLHFVTTAVAHMKTFHQERAQVRQASQVTGAGSPSSDPDWVEGTRVQSTGCPAVATGRIVARQGRGVLICWDALPGVPIFYVAPWSAGVLRLVQEDHE